MDGFRVVDSGSNNSVVGEPAKILGVGRRPGLVTVEFRGSDCSLEIGPNVVFRKECRFVFYRDNQHIKIAGRNRLTMSIHLKGAGSVVSIGRGTNNNGLVWMNLGEPGDRIEIGANCLFATVDFRTSHSHPIFDIETGQRINPSGPIIVGDHVWIAEDVTLFGGATVGAGSVIGARSLVTSAIQENCLAVGVPAKCIRSGIRWDERMSDGNIDEDPHG